MTTLFNIQYTGGVGFASTIRKKAVSFLSLCGFLAPLALGGLGSGLLTSCSDFSDYNESPVDATPSGNHTLWENISQNPQLSDFASLVKQAGFVDQLNTPRALTVWAPVNGSFSVADYQGLSASDLLTQFVKSHVAEYVHPASGPVDERIHTLNKKSFLFAGDGSYTFDDIAISQANIPGNNGIMHLLGGAARFYPNLYEYLSTAPGIDSLRNHFLRYELTYLDQEASVKGPMVNGAQTYIDSVVVTVNQLTNQLNARIQNEDSSYTFIMPNNEAFVKMYNKVKPYNNFITTTTVNDVENYSSASDTKTKTVTVDASYMADSLTRRAIVRNLIYSNNDMYNQWVIGKGQYTDTLRSTTRNKFSNPRDLLEHYLVGEPQEMSNGYARVVDSLAFYPWETYCPEQEYEIHRYMASLFPASAQMNRQTIVMTDGSPLTPIFGPDTDIREYRYGWISPGGDRAKPDFFVKLPNVQSTTYNFYVVFLPTALLAGDERPNWLNFQLSYCGTNGKTATYNFSKACADSLRTGGPLPNMPSTVNANTAFNNDPLKTDTVFIGRFTFPVSYNGLGEDYYPSIRVTSPISVFSSQQLQTYTRDVRIAAIILRPVELDEYEAKNK